MIALLDTVVVLGFPALAVWAARTGGTRRLWFVAGSVITAFCVVTLAAASAKFGNRLVAQQGYGKPALLIVLMAVITVGLPVLAGTLSVQRARRGITSTLALYVLGVAAAFVALLVGSGLAMRLIPALV